MSGPRHDGFRFGSWPAPEAQFLPVMFEEESREWRPVGQRIFETRAGALRHIERHYPGVPLAQRGCLEMPVGERPRPFVSFVSAE